MTQTIDVQGVTVPRVGFGTWQITGEECYEAVRHALELGYRHIDTARAYDNEEEVGRAIADAGVPREEVFLTTKIWTSEFGADALPRAAADSLRKLGTDHVDLLLLHWPNPDVPLEETLGALAREREAGRARLIGVSNFPPGLLERALRLGPVANDQVEFHPYLGQDRLLALAETHELFVTAYSPLAQGDVARDPVLREIGEEHGRTPGQVALRWLLDHERVVVVPKSASPQRRAENFDAFGFELSDDQRARIDALPKDRRQGDPSWAPDWNA